MLKEMDSKAKLRLLLFIYCLYGLVLILLGAFFPTPSDSSTDTKIRIMIGYLDQSNAGISSTKQMFIIYGFIVLILIVFLQKSLLLDNKRFLKWCRLLLLIAVAIKIGSGSIISSHILKKKYVPIIRNKLIDNFNNIPIGSSRHLKTQMFFEKKYDCCGVDNYTDYNIVYDTNNLNYPKSCCIKYDKYCTLNDEIKPDGCFDKLLIAFHTSFVPLLVAILIGSIIESVIQKELKIIIEKPKKICEGDNLPQNPTSTNAESTAV